MGKLNSIGGSAGGAAPLPGQGVSPLPPLIPLFPLCGKRGKGEMGNTGAQPPNPQAGDTPCTPEAGSPRR